jgi:hypothetical protein
MTAVEIVVLVVAVIAACAAVLSSGGTVGPKSLRGRMRGRSEGDSIARDPDPTYFAP